MTVGVFRECRGFGTATSALPGAHVLHHEVVHDTIDDRHGDENAKGVGDADCVKLIVLQDCVIPAAELVDHEDLEGVRVKSNVVAPNPPAAWIDTQLRSGKR